MVVATMLVAQGGSHSMALAREIDSTGGAQVIAIERGGRSALHRLERIDAEYVGRRRGQRREGAVVDVVLIDIDDPSIDGPELVRHLHERRRDMAVVVLASRCTAATLREAFCAGATGVLTKDCPVEEVVAGLRRAAHHGGRVLSQGATEVLINALVHGTGASPAQEELAQRAECLPPRLWKVYTQVIAGASNHRIARLLGLTDNTVRVYVSDVLRRLGFHARTELIAAHAGNAGAGAQAWPRRRRTGLGKPADQSQTVSSSIVLTFSEK